MLTSLMQVTSVERGSIAIFFAAAASMIVPIISSDFYVVCMYFLYMYACAFVRMACMSFSLL
jgi:hypothetical protein